MDYKIALIPGDGIGPEIVREAKKVLDKVCEKYGHSFSYSEVLLGGASIDVHGVPLTDEAIATAKSSDAVLMGSIGGDAKTSPWYKLEPSKRPEAGLLGIRKALNLGHTAGHAFESLALAENRPVLHGYAVAWGIVCELYLSHLKAGFPKDKMRQTIQFIKENYGSFAFDCKQYEQLYAFMQHDKKNTSGMVNFTLLKEIGDICINQTADKDTIFEMLDFYRECMGV